MQKLVLRIRDNIPQIIYTNHLKESVLTQKEESVATLCEDIAKVIGLQNTYTELVEIAKTSDNYFFDLNYQINDEDVNFSFGETLMPIVEERKNFSTYTSEVLSTSTEVAREEIELFRKQDIFATFYREIAKIMIAKLLSAAVDLEVASFVLDDENGDQILAELMTFNMAKHDLEFEIIGMELDQEVEADE